MFLPFFNFYHSLLFEMFHAAEKDRDALLQEGMLRGLRFSGKEFIMVTRVCFRLPVFHFSNVLLEGLIKGGKKKQILGKS